ncbi:AMP-binding protein [Tamlana sp. 2201CG12-4]|uniref:AMP-binding protein n=1 Tax=Tamlana sp. 2201CG12-4 TaxID=3112582 RepID=UPI002DBD935D|nr:AMP-binding protein [Tamlana sp. 2201CG12-4]MEC3908023.1 AMP-binding protein [Tamlana sp. 2201CG12-4]
MNFLNTLQESFSINATKNALCINDTFFTYKDLSNCVLKIRKIIQTHINSYEKLIGLVANNDLETYATIFALWLEGKAYVPINPLAPKERNSEIFKLTESTCVFDSTMNSLYSGDFKVFSTPSHYKTSKDHILSHTPYVKYNMAYILFTSGSTGKPKGIPISFENLNALLSTFDNDSEYTLNSTDKCLQMYDLTFDASLTAFMPTFLAGACSYTVPSDSIKYFYIFKLMQKYDLTVLKMVPSIIYYLRPYFSEINRPNVRYCIFGGGKLFKDVVDEWATCVPNSKIYNHYGPTECTVCSSYYSYSPSHRDKSHNGILSIGKPLAGIDYIIINNDKQILKNKEEGELCLSGKQLTKGYWKNEKLNSTLFFNVQLDNGEVKRFYKTGDICFMDNDGYLMYVERKDFQVKVRGYRVELGEIEYHIKSMITKNNLVVIDINNTSGNNEIALVIEGNKLDASTTSTLFNYLQTKLPNYMVPTQTHFLDQLPYNNNGKLDRNQLRKLITKN